LIRGSRFIEHSTKFRRLPLRLRGLSLGVGNLALKLDGLLEGSQQEALAGGQIVRKKVGVIHHAHCCSDCRKKRQSTLGIFF
jgi:hypothetical protein